MSLCSTLIRSHYCYHRACRATRPIGSLLFSYISLNATFLSLTTRAVVTMAHTQGKSVTVDHAVQKMDESSLEATCREQADFPKIEKELNFERFTMLEEGVLDRVTGLLGSKNPFHKKALAKDQEVWLFDNTAFKQIAPNVHNAEWQAEFVACYFHKGRKDITRHVSQIADLIGLDGQVGLNDDVRKLIAERLQPFFSAIAPARTIEISIHDQAGQGQKVTLGPSNSNGISSQIISVGGNEAADGTTITSTNASSEYATCSSKTRFAGPEGWAIISDIDDTIKVTQSSNPIGILQTTFAEEPRTTEGMEDFYKLLDQQFAKPAWFYLSASPYNLYPFLHKFLHQYYLPGTIILRDASWMFFGGLLQSLTQGVQEYKTSRMEKIHQWLPQRKIICIGDSTQKDPESYAEIYKKYPGWIKAIYIRKVVDVPFMELRNKEERFQDAFKDVPAGVWKVFVTPDEVVDHMKQLN